MPRSSLVGIVIAETITVRFAYSGRISLVLKRTGDLVKAGQTLAALDKKPFQAELDKELSDYEQARSEFEIFNHKNPGPGDTITTYLKKSQQARLNASVKSVELSKMRLDQTELRTPVSGLVVDSGGNRVGLNMTPSANAYQILDFSSFMFEISLPLPKLSDYLSPKPMTFKLDSINKEYSGQSSIPLPKSKDQFIIRIPISDPIDLLPGLTGHLLP